MPDEAAPLVRALLAADRNQHFARSRMSEEQRTATPVVDFRPFIIADADTGHGGDAHVRNLVRRFVEVGVPGYHIEDQKPGVKKCGHQGGKVLVADRTSRSSVSTPRASSSTSWGSPGIIVARTDAEAATLLDGRGGRARSAVRARRDQPRGAELPGRRPSRILRKLAELGVDEIRGHLLYAIPEAEYAEADRRGSTPPACSRFVDRERRAPQKQTGAASVDGMLDKVADEVRRRLADRGRPRDLRQAVADVIEFRASRAARSST